MATASHAATLLHTSSVLGLSVRVVCNTEAARAGRSAATLAGFVGSLATSHEVTPPGVCSYPNTPLRACEMTFRRLAGSSGLQLASAGIAVSKRARTSISGTASEAPGRGAPQRGQRGGSVSVIVCASSSVIGRRVWCAGRYPLPTEVFGKLSNRYVALFRSEPDPSQQRFGASQPRLADEPVRQPPNKPGVRTSPDPANLVSGHGRHPGQPAADLPPLYIEAAASRLWRRF